MDLKNFNFEETLGKNYKDYNYYTFKHRGDSRFVFITKFQLNFSALELKLGKMANPFLVEGALFDTKRNCFIRFSKNVKPRNGEYFYEYLIYDAGVPNVVYNRAEDKYVIMCINKINLTGISFIFADEIQGVVSSLEEGKKGINHTRAIFYKAKEFKEETATIMVVFKDSIDFICKKVQFELVECLIGENRTGKEIDYLRDMTRISYEADDRFCVNTETEDATSQVDIPAYFICGDSCMIVKSALGEFGDYITIILKEKILIDEKYSCFAYKRVKSKNAEYANDLIIENRWRRNDFDNELSYFNVTKRKVFSLL